MAQKKAHAEKQIKTDAVAKRLENAELVILTHNKGMTHQMDRELRNNLRKEGATIMVLRKNTLVARAAQRHEIRIADRQAQRPGWYRGLRTTL
jgi:ribosomal protein L10